MVRKKVRLLTKSFAIILVITAFVLVTFTGCYFQPKPPEHLRILFTTDTQGMFTSCGCVGGPRGGMERRATAIREATENAPGDVLLIDTGNFSTGYSSDEERMKAEFVVRAMAEIGYDAINIGRMDARRPRLGVSMYDQPGFPLTSAGYTYVDEETEERVFSYPTRIVTDLDGFKIAIIGSHLDNFLDPEDFGFENQPTVQLPELFNVIDNVFSEDDVGMVILISDISTSWQQAQFTASRFNNVSIMIGGQSADPDFSEEKRDEEIDQPIFVPRASTWGRSLGILDLVLTETGGIERYHLEYVDLNDEIEVDPDFADMTEEYLTAIDIEPTGVPELRQAGYIGPDACMNCHEMEYTHWQGSRHAEAWETLEEAGRLRESSCIPCHTTGYSGNESFPSRMVAYEFRAVSCEACHGPGEGHVILKSDDTGFASPVDGEIIDEIVLLPDQTVCIVCHKPPHDEGWIYSIKIGRITHE